MVSNIVNISSITFSSFTLTCYGAYEAYDWGWVVLYASAFICIPKLILYTSSFIIPKQTEILNSFEAE